LLSACILIRSSHGKYEEVVERIRRFNGVQKIFPVIGRYDVVVDLETETLENIGNTVLKMGRIAGVVFTETLIEIQHKEN